MKKLLRSLAILTMVSPAVYAQEGAVSEVWVADQGDGTYKNPIIHADYSDPDVCRVGDDYYMTASSFNCVPGLPVLHSKDLVNWDLIGYALDTQYPEDHFSTPQHGNGVWAPSIRYQDGEFYIFYGDPDFGIYMMKASKPEGPWTKPHLVKAGTGLIDPCPLWDDDGKAYLVHAFAGSRAGVKSVLMVHEMTPDGKSLIGEPVMVFDGHDDNPTVEGAKFYKHDGYYYIFAPAGGVAYGWQLAMRSESPFGPYKAKRVLEQGSTNINGPHQGGWVETLKGEYWFIHFQDKEAYGRVVHLQPMSWHDGWPVMGEDFDGNGVGEPVLTYKKPDIDTDWQVVTPPENDEFNSYTTGVQWQWHANPKLKYGYPSGNLGYYRLNCRPRPQGARNLWGVPNMLLQKFPAVKFVATTKLTFNHRFDGEETGFVVMGDSYQYISLKQENKKLLVCVVRCKGARKGGNEEVLYEQEVDNNTVYFRIEVRDGALCSFSFSENGRRFKTVGEEFQAVPGRWIGAKIGYFALRDGIINDAGNVNIDWFRIKPLK
ncbi:glycoside hydrolase family 43 protein [Anaerophaga thermohalophila]|uniref:glycoside hydrolase family 43 protein n=1 Tax=Anaerophaga thermohalophila TaxID=177400 RepID=UPI000237CFAA|nr:glycoside hydrolase 43 family protein [Anaerophaga thermohalophila]